MKLFNRTEHVIRMAFDEEYAERYETLRRGRKELIGIGFTIFRDRPGVLLLLLMQVVFFTWVFNLLVGIMSALLMHLISYSSVVIPEYIKLKKSLDL